MSDFFIYVIFEGKNDSNIKLYKNYALSYECITEDFVVLEEFVEENPLWGAIWIDLFGLEGLVIPIVELFDEHKVEQAVNFIVTFMGEQFNPCHDITYINRVYVFKECTDSDDNSLLVSFISQQMATNV